MNDKTLEFGWAAKPFAEQIPDLNPKDAEHFDRDNAAITRLSIRGFITGSQRDAAIQKVTRAIGRALHESRSK